MWYLINGLELARMLAVVLVIAWYVRAWRANRAADDRPRCRACGYDLTGLPTTSDRCPECGSNLASPRAIRIGPQSVWLPRGTVWRILAVIAIYVGGHMCIAGLRDYQREVALRPGLLEVAIRNSDLASVKQLLAKDPSLVTRRGKTFLSDAAAGPSPGILSEILKHGKANVTAADMYANGSPTTLLHIAARAGRVKNMRILLDEGLSIESKDAQGATPIRIAALSSESLPAVQFLIEQGADVDAADAAGETPIIAAARNHQPGTIKALLAGGSKALGVSREGGLTPFQLMLEQSRRDIATLMLDSVPDLLKREPLSWLATNATTEHARRNAVELVLTRISMLRQRDGIGGVRQLLADDPGIARLRTAQGPLLLQFVQDRDGIFEAMLDAGADVNAADDQGVTPLHHAARGMPNNIAMLLDRGANINAADKQGRTPLMVACKSAWAIQVKLLLDRGAAVDPKDVFGENALFYAAMGHDTGKSVDLLLSKGLPLTLPAAIVLGRIDEVHRILREQPKLVNDANNSTGFTPLHFAAKADNIAAVAVLLEAGAEIDPGTKEEKMTPLVVALNYNSRRAALLLVGYGADVAPDGASFQPPLHMAVWKGHRDVVEKMLQRKVDINLRNRNGETPLHVACQLEHFNMIRFLVAAGADLSAVDKQGRTPTQRVSNRPEVQKKLGAALNGE